VCHLFLRVQNSIDPHVWEDIVFKFKLAAETNLNEGEPGEHVPIHINLVEFGLLINGIGVAYRKGSWLGGGLNSFFSPSKGPS
jgi:hypothetical protein